MMNNLRNELSQQVSEIYKSKDLSSIKDVVAQKIDGFTNNLTNQSFYKFCEDLKEEITEGRVERASYFNFPNYVCIIELPTKYLDEGSIEVRQSLIICISILVDFYTMYFEERYYFLKFKRGKSVSPCYAIHFFDEGGEALKEKVNLQFILEKMGQYFPTKILAPHNLLKEMKIEGHVPFGNIPPPDDLKIAYSFFELLFDNTLSTVPPPEIFP